MQTILGIRFGRFASVLLAASALVLALCGSSAHAQSRASRFGLGGMVGEPTGLSMKLRLSPAFAIDFGVGFGILGPGYGQAHADFLGAVNLADLRRTSMDIYFGAGPRVAFAGHGNGRWDGRSDGAWVGVRGAVGLVWEFDARHLDVFVEAAPTLWLLQGLYFDAGGAAGARYWF